MEKIAPKMPEIKKTKETERGSLLKWFMEALNTGRKAAGYKPYTYARMGKLLEGQPLDALYFIQSSMKQRDTEAAAKYFYWSIRPHEEEKVNE